ncbi:DUF6468 domain-containing protein [Methylobrevis pamukkalensis]|uniref:DUF6468 domain-containing protein n=1 Tax=Methylobrevis pamukkalensis TaxID=1439726 RepID=UPI0008460EBF|nr:DUF6468 domain-containing protein [Methylobrevis pamukkalensis]
MTEFVLGLTIEIVVALLLVTTIVYCYQLNRRLTRLRADENVLRATIAELITATEIAERAIRGLKVTAADCENTLGRSLMAAEATCSELDRRVVAGEDVVRRIGAITRAAMLRPGEAQAPASQVPAIEAPVAAPMPVPAPAAPTRAEGARSLQEAASAAAERLSAYRRSPREAAA